MTNHSSDDDEKPLDPEQQRLVARVRWLMLVSGLATVLGIAVVVGVVIWAAILWRVHEWVIGVSPLA